MSNLVYLNGWTKETVIEHVKKEFKGMSVLGSACSYRGNGGKKCIAGCFIKDEDYNPKMDTMNGDTTIAVVCRTFTNLVNHFPFDLKTMTNWQRIHDELNEKSSNEEQLRKLLDFLE